MIVEKGIQELAYKEFCKEIREMAETIKEIESDEELIKYMSPLVHFDNPITFTSKLIFQFDFHTLESKYYYNKLKG